MIVLDWFFRKITPIGKNTWLSLKYNRWISSIRERNNKKFKEYPDEIVVYFEVPGAGEIAISENPNHICGNAAGFGFRCSWSTEGFSAGGVLGKDEAKRMAIFILKACNKDSRTEKEILLNFYNFNQKNNNNEEDYVTNP